MSKLIWLRKYTVPQHPFPINEENVMFVMLQFWYSKVSDECRRI